MTRAATERNEPLTLPTAPRGPVARPIPLGVLPTDPLVTVAITNYNYARFVGRAIESVLAQTHRNLEVVVVDDGSTDDSVRVIEPYVLLDPRVRLVRKPNGGMASAWNEAYRHARGDVFCPLDADDEFHPRKLEVLIDRFARDPGAALAVHAMTVLDGEGRAVQTLPFLTRFERGWLAEAVRRRGGRWRYMPTSALGVRRELCAYLFPVPEDTFARHADALAVTLGPLLSRVVAVDEPLSYYRTHGGNSLGGGSRDRGTAEQVLDFSRRTTRGVNARLAALGVPVRLDLRDNLEFRQAAFVRALFGRSPRLRLGRRYAALAAAIARDDLYGPAQKAAGLVVYGVAWLLPARARGWWVAQTLGYTRFKGRLKAALDLRRAPLRALGRLGERLGLRPRRGDA